MYRASVDRMSQFPVYNERAARFYTPLVFGEYFISTLGTQKWVVANKSSYYLI